MVYMHQQKKRGYEDKALRIRAIMGRGKRIIQVPLSKSTKVKVSPEFIRMENCEETFEVNKQPGLFDEGIIITGEVD